MLSPAPIEHPKPEPEYHSVEEEQEEEQAGEPYAEGKASGCKFCISLIFTFG